MVLYNASGTALGGASAAGAVTVNFNLGASFLGSSTASAAVGVNYISSGTALGSSFGLQQLIEAAGEAQGSSSAALGVGVVIMNATGVAQGSASANLSAPLPAQGTSFMSAHGEVSRPLPPVEAKLCCPKAFNWLQLLQRGDLALYLCNGDAGGVGVVHITYSFIQVRPDGSRQKVGPQERIPVRGRVGEYWATGLAGESGQPGCWVIEWRYQVSTGDPICVVEQPFRVLDAVMRANPKSQLDRKIKFGWN
jgi:hypothetical protein